MRLEGIHHITAITADARACVDFYARVLGLRLVKRTVNYDAPELYHLYFGDELGTPGSLLAFFEQAGAGPGRTGAGMISRIAWRVADERALEFWAERLTLERCAVEPLKTSLRFEDREGLAHELQIDMSPDKPLIARSAEVPTEMAIRGLAGITAYAHAPVASDGLLIARLGFSAGGRDAYRVDGVDRSATYAFEQPPPDPGVEGAGSVHHVAWSSRDADHEEWHAEAIEGGADVTSILDRTYFNSFYFREPSGVLFEVATQSPGFTVDEEQQRLGASLKLPDRIEFRRPDLERALAPIENPRQPPDPEPDEEPPGAGPTVSSPEAEPASEDELEDTPRTPTPVPVRKVGDFRWHDGDRVVVFDRMALRSSAVLLDQQGWDDYELLTTERALEAAPRELSEGSRRIHRVPLGGVPECAAKVLDEVDSRRLVALGGGRVIDTAKAIAAVRDARVCAIPTTLSGAEMTALHRLPDGYTGDDRVRPELILAEPATMCSLPERALRASAMNALAHGAESLYVPEANPVSTMCALRGLTLIATALDADRQRRDTDTLALGALLCGAALGWTRLAIHHVLSQTVARMTGVAHADANATMLPHTMAAMARRAPAAIAALSDALGVEPSRLSARIAELSGGGRRLRELGVDRAQFGALAGSAARRRQLAATPNPPTRSELDEILRAAW